VEGVVEAVASPPRPKSCHPKGHLLPRSLTASVVSIPEFHVVLAHPYLHPDKICLGTGASMASSKVLQVLLLPGTEDLVAAFHFSEDVDVLRVVHSSEQQIQILSKETLHTIDSPTTRLCLDCYHLLIQPADFATIARI
jgi:hypothetical protein